MSIELKNIENDIKNNLTRGDIIKILGYCRERVEMDQHYVIDKLKWPAISFSDAIVGLSLAIDNLLEDEYPL